MAAGVANIFQNIRAASFLAASRLFSPFDALLERCIPPALRAQAEHHFKQIADRIDRRLGWEVRRPDFLSHLIALRAAVMNDMSTYEIYSNISIMSTAGSETTATALTGVASYLVTHPQTLRRLTSEVRTAFASEEAITLAAVERLPYLSAVINEGLRLCPPVPMIMPRIAPKEGATVAGSWVPGGVGLPRAQRCPYLSRLTIVIFI